MIKYYKGDLYKFVKLLDENVEVFLSGKDIYKDNEICVNKNQRNMRQTDVPNKTPKSNQQTSSVKIENGKDVNTTILNNDNVNNVQKELQNLSLSTNKPRRLNSYKFPVTQIKKPNLVYKCEQKNVSLLAAAQISISVECARCKKRSSFRTETYTNNYTCINCMNQMTIMYTPTTSSQFLGNLLLKNCKFIAFNPFKFQLSCSNCIDSAYETQELHKNCKFTMNCYDCNGVLILNVIDIIYRSDKKKEQVVSNNGTCKHYKKSQRLFRFPCCNVLYPCDICHDEDNDHKSELAHRMVCGLCNKEQSVKAKCDCGKNLIGKSSKHWEGGKGNRDKVKMSKKDDKKYKK
ncbi:hypothetical protein BDAP_002492 [Binucleata daphniae]